ncbi:MAG: nitroreductase family protein [Planctomycetes bacterium]|nr:nitroreductase family protein [Planctomycetota bacterium]
MMPSLVPSSTVEAAVRFRRATRRFRPDPIQDGILERALELANWAPSGWNLQPTHFVVVRSPEQKRRLRAAVLGQKQVEEAPATVVFLGDLEAVRTHFEEVLRMDREAGANSADYEALLRKLVPLTFAAGPLGLGGLAKHLGVAAYGLFRPAPALSCLPAARRLWTARQVMLSAMTFMLAAASFGLDTGPMEGFDARRVREVVGAPRRMLPVVIVAVGTRAAEPKLTKTRLPLERKLHREQFTP